MTVIEYVWITHNSSLHSKTRVIVGDITTLNDIPHWNYDGSSTNQTDVKKSEVTLVPRALFNNPLRGSESRLVLCDCYTNDGVALSDNSRYTANIIMEKYKDLEPWFGLEQEYFLYKNGDIYPLGFVDGKEPSSHYCGTLLYNSGRDIAEEHLTLCIDAGIKISGINSEVVTGQWEFQIGPCEGIEQGDHLWMARFLLGRVCEKYNMYPNYAAKPLHGYNGSGCHMNYSTKEMRMKGGIQKIVNAIEKLKDAHDEHMELYGDGNQDRMTGTHETSSYSNFTYGYGDRTSSVRIGYQTYKDGYGYFEDRRPASTIDPYIITSKMVETTNRL